MEDHSTTVLAGPLGHPVQLGTVSPASPMRMRRLVGHPLDQPGSNVGQFRSLGHSQALPQQHCGSHPAGWRLRQALLLGARRQAGACSRVSPVLARLEKGCDTQPQPWCQRGWCSPARQPRPLTEDPPTKIRGVHCPSQHRLWPCSLGADGAWWLAFIPPADPIHPMPPACAQ